MSESQIFVGLGLILALAVGCQIVAAKFGIPAIILLLPISEDLLRVDSRDQVAGGESERLLLRW